MPVPHRREEEGGIWRMLREETTPLRDGGGISGLGGQARPGAVGAAAPSARFQWGPFEAIERLSPYESPSRGP